MRAKTLAVWGHKGRTTFAVNLAWMLAHTKKDKLVTLLSCNLTYGDIQGFFGVAIWEKHGLSRALAGEEHPRSFLWKAGEERPSSDIFLMTLANDSDALLFDPPDETKTERLLDQLADEQTDYLVVDCAGDVHNPLSDVALVQADSIYCLHTPGNAAYQWYRAMRSLREQLDLDEKMLHLLYASDHSANVAQYLHHCGVNIREEIPWVRGAKEYENRGVPLCAENNRENRGYIAALQRLCSTIK
ncbi:MAG: hypothetical protein FWF06_00960 [Symbiobacteriaceae bacterium]|nr:hypothetical protein [Symbiobacteriaceae bacterium]